VPNRILREGILDSEDVCSLTEQGEIFYRRLMSIVDDSGRFELKPSLIRARAFPLNLEAWPLRRIEESLSEVSQQQSADGQERSLVSLYEVEGKKYLQINNFGQRERYVKHPGSDQGRLLAVHRRPNALSESESEALVGDEVEDEVSVLRTSPPKAAPSWGLQFAEWWEIWPRKTGKADALKAYHRIVVNPKDGAFHERHLRLMQTTPLWVEREFAGRESSTIPYPATFLRRLDWLEAPPEPTAAPPRPSRQQASLDEMLRRNAQ
jgi:hypothetical protein